MAKKSFVSGGRTFEIEVTETSYSIDNNSSNVKWKLTISGSGGEWNDSYLKATVNGTVVYNQTKGWQTGEFPAKDGSVEGTIYGIQHDNEGKKTISFAMEGYSFYYTVISTDGTLVLTTIPRQSTITATRAYIGETSQLTITKNKDDYIHTIEYSFGNLGGYILADGTTTSTAVKISATSIGFTIPSTWYQQIPNDSSGTCTLTITTYNGDVQIGSAATTTFVVEVDEAASKPTISATATDANQSTIDLTGDSNILIRGHSIVSLVWNTTARNSASISSVTVNGITVSTSPYTFILDSNAIVIQSTDSRGFITTYSPTFTLKDYLSPNYSINVSRVSPTSSYANLSFNGTWFNDSFGDENNELSIIWKYKKTTDSTWTTGGTLTPGTDYTISNNNFWSGTSSSSSDIQIGGSLDYNYGWDIAVIISDALDTVSMYATITKGIPVINWGSDFFNVNGDIKQNNVSIFSSFVNAFYPVGSIYMTVDSTKNPNAMFSGTTWVQLKDKFLLGSGDTYTNGDTGGEATVKLTTNEIPSHKHVATTKTTSYASGSQPSWRCMSFEGTSADYTQTIETGSTGGGQAHNNMPPYLVVCIWKRIS